MCAPSIVHNDAGVPYFICQNDKNFKILGKFLWYGVLGHAERIISIILYPNQETRWKCNCMAFYTVVCDNLDVTRGYILGIFTCKHGM